MAAEIPKEQRMNLAIEAFNKGQFQPGTACARAFDVPPRTLIYHLNGKTSRHEMTANCRELSELEEETLSRWILDMYERGLPLQVSNVRYLAQLLLSARLKSPEKATIGELWRTPANLYQLNQQKNRFKISKKSLYLQWLRSRCLKSS